MSAEGARVIDLQEYRLKRAARSAAAAPMTTPTLVWYPVPMWCWVPVWMLA